MGKKKVAYIYINGTVEWKEDKIGKKVFVQRKINDETELTSYLKK